MTLSIKTRDLPKICNDLYELILESSKRGLLSIKTWASELYYALSANGLSVKQISPDTLAFIISPLEPEFCEYQLAKCYFDNQEYDRAAYFTKQCSTSVVQFLHFYSTYCSGEKKRLDDIADLSLPVEKSKNHALKTLRHQLEKAQSNEKLDGYGLYLYGVVLKKLQVEKVAIEILCDAIRAEPLNWGSWLELSSLITDRETLNSLVLPNHWIKNFFLAHTYVELQLNEMAVDLYTQIAEIGFSKSTYVMAQLAVAYNNMKDLQKSVDTFKELVKVDPYRLDNMDVYSNLLYIKEMRVELSYLAHNTCDIDKYRVETCCVIGNFYSLRKQHEKAVLYFQRALRLNPNYLSAWTLMGHEYMEMKNTSAAIQAYRQAIEVNRQDFRAWYGLGQTYEILKMTFYCLYYYKQVQRLRPHDSRMMVALGETYEKLDKIEEATKCYWRAHAVGDVEGMALNKLAKMYSKLNEEDQAAAAYSDFIRDANLWGLNARDELCHAYLFLAQYHLKHKCLEKAYENAQQCMEYPETKEDAKTILKQIAARRAEEDKSSLTPHAVINTPQPYYNISAMDLTPTP